MERKKKMKNDPPQIHDMKKLTVSHSLSEQMLIFDGARIMGSLTFLCVFGQIDLVSSFAYF